MAGLSFSDQDDAEVFFTKVTTREITTKKTSSKKKKGKFKIICTIYST